MVLIKSIIKGGFSSSSEAEMTERARELERAGGSVLTVGEGKNESVPWYSSVPRRKDNCAVCTERLQRKTAGAGENDKDLTWQAACRVFSEVSLPTATWLKVGVYDHVITGFRIS